MDKVRFMMRPRIGNALIPLILTRIWKDMWLFVVFFGVTFLIGKSGIIGLSVDTMLIFAIIVIILYLILGVAWKIIVLANTKYYFYNTYLSSDFRFFKIERKIIPYQRITNITVAISIWDRICRAGDVTIHTADDEVPNVVLEYLPNPEGIQRKIMDFIQKK